MYVEEKQTGVFEEPFHLVKDLLYKKKKNN